MKDERKTKKQLIEELEQARLQLTLERAANRIREQALAMRASDDLRQVVVTALEEMVALGVESPQCSFLFVDEEDGVIRSYNAMEHPRRYGVSWLPKDPREMGGGMVVGSAVERISVYSGEFLEAWRSGRPSSTYTEHMEESEFVRELRSKCPDVVRIAYFSGEWSVTNVPFADVMVGFRERDYVEDHVAVVQVLAEALSVGYMRFLDFQKVDEAQRRLIDELEEELRTAHDLQMGLMPANPPAIEGLDIAGRCLPANHVGGDFFQYFHLPDGHLAVAVSDVTGHGMEAAIPAVMFSGILRTEMRLDKILGQLYRDLNRTLCETLVGEHTHICLVMAELDTRSLALKLANGGCPRPYHYQAECGEVCEIAADAYPLGIRPATEYDTVKRQLTAGDYLVFCSDGFMEAQSSSGEVFGYERTAETLRGGCAEGLSAERLIGWLQDAVSEFVGDAPQGDDMTCVVLKVEA